MRLFHFHLANRARRRAFPSALTTACEAWFFAVFFCIFSWTPSSQMKAQEMPIGIQAQAEMFRKIFVFNRTMEGKKIKTLIAYNTASAALVEEISAAFQARGVETLAAREDAVERTLKENKGKIHALYIMPGVVNSFDKLCTDNQILSITGVPALARSGKASIALGVRNAKPSIIVHLQQMKNEGQEVSASLLQIAQIVQ